MNCPNDPHFIIVMQPTTMTTACESLRAVDYSAISNPLFISEEEIESHESLKSLKSLLLPSQQRLARGIALTLRRLQDPTLTVDLPIGDILCTSTRQQITKLWLSDMESELWSIMYQGTSDVFGAFECLTEFQSRICATTDLNSN